MAIIWSKLGMPLSFSFPCSARAKRVLKKLVDVQGRPELLDVASWLVSFRPELVTRVRRDGERPSCAYLLLTSINANAEKPRPHLKASLLPWVHMLWLAGSLWRTKAIHLKETSLGLAGRRGRPPRR
jgi:hypothetical protein